MAPPHRSNRWSQLPNELLELVAGYLSLLDLVRFGAVCITWRSVAADQKWRRSSRCLVQLPRLLPHRATPRGTTLGFFSTCRGRFLDLDFPGAFLGGAARCCGSCLGWLAMVDDAQFDVCLLNPVTRARVQLPSRSHFPFRPPVNLGERPRDPIRYLRKVVMSSDPASSGCTVAAIGRSNVLALCRLGRGDARWTVFEGDHHGGFEDVAFYGDQLCALDFLGRLTICSLAASAPAVTNFVVVEPSEDVGGQQGCHRRRRLVGSCGELLMAVRKYDAYAGDASMATKLRVFRLGMDGWERVDRLGERMLFVGEVSSESVTVDDVAVQFPGFRANCVYFTGRMVERATPRAYGVFCMETGCVLPVSDADPHLLLLEEPVWVMAALR